MSSARLEQLYRSGELAKLAHGCRSEAQLAQRVGMTSVAYKSAKKRAKGKGAPIPDLLELLGLAAVDWNEEPTNEEIPLPVEPVIPDGHRIKGLSSLVDADGNVRAQWIKTDAAKEETRAELFEAIGGLANAWPERIAAPVPEHADDDLLCVYLFGDPHFGMYAWGEETGDDYDLELAEAYHLEAIDRLVAASPPAAEALIISIGDLSHADNSSNMTPRSGHILDVDTRRPKVLRTITRALRGLVEKTRTKHKKSNLWLVPGNHDPETTVALQIALGMFFENDVYVDVEQSPAISYYKRFGKNLIGATHGHTAKHRGMLGEAMAADRKEDWGETDYRYFYTGHVHQDSVTETRSGVLIETLRTLAGKDKYAADNFYRSGRDAKCDVLHREHGRIIRNTIGIRQIQRRLGQ